MVHELGGSNKFWEFYGFYPTPPSNTTFQSFRARLQVTWPEQIQEWKVLAWIFVEQAWPLRFRNFYRRTYPFKWYQILCWSSTNILYGFGKYSGNFITKWLRFGVLQSEVRNQGFILHSCPLKMTEFVNYLNETQIPQTY